MLHPEKENGSALAAIPKRPDQETIRLLEKALEKARNGEVTGVVIVQSFSDGCTNHCWAGIGHNCIRVTGELTITATAMANMIEATR